MSMMGQFTRQRSKVSVSTQLAANNLTKLNLISHVTQQRERESMSMMGQFTRQRSKVSYVQGKKRRLYFSVPYGVLIVKSTLEKSVFLIARIRKVYFFLFFFLSVFCYFL
jgi:hypothetical protein